MLTVEEILTLPKEVESDWQTVMELIYTKKFTGPVIVNCHLGVPKTIQVPPPQIRLKD